MMQGSLAEKLRVLRARMGLSITEAATRAGVTRDTLSDLEHGKRHPYMPTLSKIAKGYGVPVEELLEEPVLAGKADAPREAGAAEVHKLFGVPQKKAEWREAVDDSQRFRSRAKERLREQLSRWEAINEGSSYEERREVLDAMGRILDEADGVSSKLLQNVGEGLDGTTEPGPIPYWTEYQEADTLYHELWAMVGEVGLSVRLEKTDQAFRQLDQAPGQWRHEVRRAA